MCSMDVVALYSIDRGFIRLLMLAGICNQIKEEGFGQEGWLDRHSGHVDMGGLCASDSFQDQCTGALTEGE